jgi:GDP-mannose 6-dehydrogenase
LLLASMHKSCCFPGNRTRQRTSSLKETTESTKGIIGRMKIAIFGLGYVGATMAACLVRLGCEVVGVDNNEDKVAEINAGRSPISEPKLEEMIRSAVAEKKLYATSDPTSHIGTCAVAMVCVGTPSAPDGSHNMGFIAEVSRQIASLVGPGRHQPLTVVYRSTFRPGTMDELVRPIFEHVMTPDSGAVELVYNPEFLRESFAVDDFFAPSKIVIGTQDGQPCEKLASLYKDIKAPIFYTKYREAEVTKFVDNTFHAVKVSFANEIGRICRLLDIDVNTVYEVFVADTKLNISPHYLRPGGAFGGSCLPKDVRALQFISGEIGAHTHLIDSLLRTNEAHKHYLFESCTKDLKPGADILMLGLSFKVNSDDLRESPNIDLARKLLQAGYRLSIFDPDVDPARLLGQNLGYAYSNLPAIRKLLISREQMERVDFDLVIDTRNWARSYQLKAANVAEIWHL